MKKVLILFGGNSFEHNVSCMSAKSILNNIDNAKYDVTAALIDKNNKWYIYKGDIVNIEKWHSEYIVEIENIVEFIKHFDIVFPVLHGANGEDGRLQGMLDLFNIKYVGCKTLSSAVCMDKIFSKYVFNYLNIPVVPFVEVTESTVLNEVITQFSFPMIVKPANGGSSIGISKVNNKKELKKAIKEAYKYDSKVLIEKYIVGRELECAVLVNKDIEVSTVGEIKAANEFYDYNAKYENNKSYTIIPAELPDTVITKIQDYAKKAFIGINASSLSRVDFFYDEINNQIYLNEINTMPGFTEISMYPQLFINEGYTYKELISILIENT